MDRTPLERQYEAQVTDFLCRIGAMVSVATFSAISSDELVYVRNPLDLGVSWV